MKGKEQRGGKAEGQKLTPRGPITDPQRTSVTSTCFRGEDGQGRGALQRRLGRGEPHMFQHVHLQVSAQLCKWWAQSALSSLGAEREKASIGGRRGEETASRLQEMLRPHCPCLRRQDSMQVEAGLNMITSVSGPLAIGETRPGVTMHRVFGEIRQGVSQSEYCIFWRKKAARWSTQHWKKRVAMWSVCCVPRKCMYGETRQQAG